MSVEAQESVGGVVGMTGCEACPPVVNSFGDVPERRNGKAVAIVDVGNGDQERGVQPVRPEAEDWWPTVWESGVPTFGV